MITFGIVTGKDQTSLIHQIIDSIERERIPQYEVIVIGSFLAAREHTRVYEFPDQQFPNWITKKKNILATLATYDTIVFLHDYIKLKEGWYEGFLQFQNETPNWDVAMCRMEESNGRRAMDWIGLPNDPIYGNVLFPYDYSNPKGMYVPGNFFMVKRAFFLKNPLDEKRIWGMGEDIEWSKRIFGGADNSEWLRKILRIPLDTPVPDPESPALYVMNPFSTVVFLKDKPTNPCYYETFDMHSGNNARPQGFHPEMYLYLRKRTQRKIETK
jgi:hypothetical protein